MSKKDEKLLEIAKLFQIPPILIKIRKRQNIEPGELEQIVRLEDYDLVDKAFKADSLSYLPQYKALISQLAENWDKAVRKRYDTNQLDITSVKAMYRLSRPTSALQSKLLSHWGRLAEEALQKTTNITELQKLIDYDVPYNTKAWYNAYHKLLGLMVAEGQQHLPAVKKIHHDNFHTSGLAKTAFKAMFELYEVMIEKTKQDPEKMVELLKEISIWNMSVLHEKLMCYIAIKGSDDHIYNTLNIVRDMSPSSSLTLLMLAIVSNKDAVAKGFGDKNLLEEILINIKYNLLPKGDRR